MTIDDLMNKRIGFISLGCDKNRVDLEKMIFSLKSFGFAIESDPSKANIIIVNTCAFLESARLEAIENIVEMGTYKTTGKLEKLIVTGCINELNYQDMHSSLPEVDLFVNIKDNENIVSAVVNLYGIDKANICNGRVLTTPNHYSFLKIADGCDNFCTYCLIPYIRGRYHSIPIEELISEAKNLASMGVKELILVAQDVTKYGIDLYKQKRLVELLRRLSGVDGISWIRLLYCYPEQIDDELINEIKNNDKIVKYLDIPLQHISTNVLRNMNRRSSKDSIYKLFNKLQQEIPNIILRTTFILGFPNEQVEDVEDIAEFLRKFKLQNVGFFKYSREEGTRAYTFDNQIEESIKQERLEYLSQVQYDVMIENNQHLIGKVYDVIIDNARDNLSQGRFYGQAPEIDSIVYIDEQLEVGKIYQIKLIDNLDYDFKGERL